VVNFFDALASLLSDLPRMKSSPGKPYDSLNLLDEELSLQPIGRPLEATFLCAVVVPAETLQRNIVSRWK